MPFEGTIEMYAEEMLEGCRAAWNSVIELDDAFVFDEPFTACEMAAMLAGQRFAGCALLEGRVAGLYILHENFPGRGSHLANASYAVHPAFRGRGVGRALALHSLDKARELGFRGMQFNAVVAGNTGARALWQSLGFRQVGEVPEGFRCRNGELQGLVLYRLDF